MNPDVLGYRVRVSSGLLRYSSRGVVKAGGTALEESGSSSPSQAGACLPFERDRV